VFVLWVYSFIEIPMVFLDFLPANIAARKWNG
jgi:hypothetical protein